MKRVPTQLAGLRVLVTRPEAQAGPWLAALAAAGLTPLPYPTIVVGPPPSWAPLDEAWRRLGSYEWLLFTSATAARLALDRLPAESAHRLAPGPRAADVARPSVAAVGSETADALRALGVRVDLVPDEQRQEGLLTAWAAVPAGTRVLFPQAIGGRDALAVALRARGVVVDTVPASETRPVAPLPPLPLFDAAIFASPSALRAFTAQHEVAALAGKKVVVIGPTSAATAREVGVVASVAAAPHIDAIIAALLESP